MLREFKEFILKGNAVDLAVGVVIGVAFGSVVTALVKDLITPLIGAFGGTPDFSALYFSVNGSRFMVGDFINAVLSFLINASVIFFLIVMPMNRLLAASKKGKPIDPTTKKCLECLSVIHIDAKRCAFCTSVQPKKK